MFHRNFLDFCLRLLPVLTLLAGTLYFSPILAEPDEENSLEHETKASVETVTASEPVIIDGKTLFVVRGFSALPASERASIITAKIIDAAESSDSNTVKITVQKGKLGEEITVGGAVIMVITETDAEFENAEIDVMAAYHAEAIKEAILKYRLDRSEEARVSGAINALLWTLGFVVFSVFYFQLRKRLPQFIGRHIEQRFAGVEEVTQDIVQGKAVSALVQFFLRFILLLIYCVAAYYYISFVLFSFAESRAIAQILITYVTDPVINIIMGIINYLPNLITIAIIFYFTHYAIRATKVFFTNIEAGTFKLKNFEPHWIWPSYNIVRALLIAIGVVFAFPYIPGSDSAAFQGLTILAGVMVSMGSNSVVSNVLAGLFVLYRRSANVGDRIKVGDHIGDVVRIQLTETHLKSVKNELISIPNAQMLNSEVVNYSSKIDGRGLLLHTTVGIGYEEPQEKVEAMLLEAANRTTGLKKSPPPFVLWAALADYAINYQINAYTTRGSSIPKMLSDLHRNIVAVFNENNVQIMTPSYEADTPEPKIPTEAWNGKLAKRIEP